MQPEWLDDWAQDLAIYEAAEKIGREYGVDAFDLLGEAERMLAFFDRHGRLPTVEEDLEDASC